MWQILELLASYPSFIGEGGMLSYTLCATRGTAGRGRDDRPLAGLAITRGDGSGSSFAKPCKTAL